MKSIPKIEKENKNFKQKIKEEEPKGLFITKKEKFKLKYHEKKKLIPKRKLFNGSKSSENGKDIKHNNMGLNISFSFQSKGKKDKSHEIEIKNTNILVSNSIRRKYISEKTKISINNHINIKIFIISN